MRRYARKQGKGIGERQVPRILAILSAADRPLTGQEIIERLRQMPAVSSSPRKITNTRRTPTTLEVKQFCVRHPDITTEPKKCPWTNKTMYAHTGP